MLQTSRAADQACLAQEEREVRKGSWMLPEMLLEIIQLDFIRNQRSPYLGKAANE